MKGSEGSWQLGIAVRRSHRLSNHFQELKAVIGKGLGELGVCPLGQTPGSKLCDSVQCLLLVVQA